MRRHRYFFLASIGALIGLSFGAIAIPVTAQDNPVAPPLDRGPDNQGERPLVEPPIEDNATPDSPAGSQAVTAAARLRAIVQRIDPAAELLPNGANFRVQSVPVTLVYDINADRMRLVSPVSAVGDIDTEALIRVMQANFDSTLDARYALAQGILWSTFIHPLSSLSADDFASGLGQTVNLVHTHGTSYSSGALIFGGGDSQEQQRQLIEELQDKSREI